MNQDYVVQELLGMISTQQQQGRVFPELENTPLEKIGDYMDEIIKTANEIDLHEE
jgi:hypothetical protein